MPQVQQTTPAARSAWPSATRSSSTSRSTTPGTKIQLLNLGVPNSTDFDNTGKVMQFEVVGRRVRPDEQRGLRPAVSTRSTPTRRSGTSRRPRSRARPDRRSSGRRVEDPEQLDEHARATRARAAPGRRLRLGTARRRRHHQAPPGTTSSPVQLPGRGGEPGVRRRPDLGDHEQLRRLVPPGAHPPGRLQDPHPQRQAACSATSRAPRTSRTSGRTRRSGRSCGSARSGDPTTDGRYMIHCHNLPHEDHDMMTQFRVGADVDRDPNSRPRRPARTRTATTPSTRTRRAPRRPDR